MKKKIKKVYDQEKKERMYRMKKKKKENIL